MLLSWRRGATIDPADLRNGYPVPEGGGQIPQRGWDSIRYDTLGLTDGEARAVLGRWGLAVDAGRTFTPEAFYRLLEQRGPLWVAGFSQAGQVTSHIRVVTGLQGTGQPDTTLVFINDPWRRGMTTFDAGTNTGSIYSETYAQFERAQRALAYSDRQSLGRVGSAYVAYLA